MTIEKLMNQPLTLQHRGPTGADIYGNGITGTTSTEQIVGYVEQVAAQELLVDRETYIANYHAFLPAGTQITAGDRLVDSGGNTYEVIGPPDDMYNPRLRRSSHLELMLRVTTG